MAKYTIISDNNRQFRFVITAENWAEAAEKALYILGWHLICPHIDK